MISNFFWQINKLAIRLSWLRPDSVDIGLFSSFKKKSFLFFNFFYAMNKLAIRLSWLRSDSVDIGGVHHIWKSYGWPSYVFHEYVYTWECWGLLWIWEVMDSTCICLRVYTDLCHFQRGLAWHLKCIGQCSHFSTFWLGQGHFKQGCCRFEIQLMESTYFCPFSYNTKILKSWVSFEMVVSAEIWLVCW